MGWINRQSQVENQRGRSQSSHFKRRVLQRGNLGKQVGGDIKSNKKTFLLIHAMEKASPSQKEELAQLMKEDNGNKVERVLSIFKNCKVDEWAIELKEKYMQEAFAHLEDIAVTSKRKEPFKQLALYLTERQK